MSSESGSGLRFLFAFVAGLVAFAGPALGWREEEFNGETWRGPVQVRVTVAGLGRQAWEEECTAVFDWDSLWTYNGLRGEYVVNRKDATVWLKWPEQLGDVIEALPWPGSHSLWIGGGSMYGNSVRVDWSFRRARLRLFVVLDGEVDGKERRVTYRARGTLVRQE